MFSTFSFHFTTSLLHPASNKHLKDFDQKATEPSLHPYADGRSKAQALGETIKQHYLVPRSDDEFNLPSESRRKWNSFTMTASSKGKGKAVLPVGPIVIDSDESDDEDTMDFFTFKRNPNQPLGE